MIATVPAAHVKRLERLEARRSTRSAAPAWATPLDLAEALGIALDEWQRRLLLSTARRVVVRAPRQAGKTTTIALLGLHAALAAADGLVLAISPAERQAKELVRVVRRLAGVLAIETAEGEQAVAPSAVSMAKIEFPNGARVLSVPGSTEATIRGYAKPRLILADEASRIGDDTLSAIRPMMAAAPASRLVLASTPWAKAGLFYDACADASGLWEQHRVRIEDCPRLDARFVEEERRTLPGWVFSREYLAEFADDAAVLFPAELVAAALDASVPPLFPAFSA